MKTLHGSGVSIILSHCQCPQQISLEISHVFATRNRHLNLPSGELT